MSFNNANNKIANFFKKFIKEASYYDRVKGPEDAQKYSKMVSEILQSPRYTQLKSEIRKANGVIHFISGDEYAPFVELLVKQCFPPENNDVFGMGVEQIDTDYFVDAKRFFDVGPQNDPDSNAAAQNALSNVINGTPRVITEEYVTQELGLGLVDLDKMFPPVQVPVENSRSDVPEMRLR